MKGMRLSDNEKNDVSRTILILSILSVFILSSILVDGLPTLDADDSGSCGYNATYVFNNSTGKLTITGTGDYSSIGSQPWYSYRDQIITIDINGTIQQIAEYSFAGCSNLKSVSLPNGLDKIWNCAFQACSSLSAINIPSTVTTISDYAFWYCSSLESITLPNSLTELGQYAFAYCSSLKFVSLSDSITILQTDTFVNCTSLKTIELNNNIWKISDGCFSGCSSLESITLPNSLHSLGEWAFSGCESLTSIDIPGSIGVIFNSTFGGCTNLENVVIGEGIQTIQTYAFLSCLKIKNLSIPSSVNTIDAGAISMKFFINGQPVATTPNNVSGKVWQGTGDGNLYTSSSFEIAFDPMGGTCNVQRMETNNDGKLDTLPDAWKDGFCLKGWYDIYHSKVDTSTVFVKNQTIHAEWVPSYKITFDANGGTPEITVLNTDIWGQISDIPTPLRNGYSFEGWFDSKEDGEKLIPSVYTSDRTYYAHWKSTSYEIDSNIIVAGIVVVIIVLVAGLMYYRHNHP